MNKALWVIAGLVAVAIVLGIIGFRYILSFDWFFGG